MNEGQPAQKGRKSSNVSRRSSSGFSDSERAAMKERAQELKAGEKKREGEEVVLAKIADMPEPDRSMAQRIHEIIKSVAPQLTPRTWYGMPAYAQDDKVICFFQSAQKFNTRYATLGFTDRANLDEGNLWAVAFAVKELSPEAEKMIAELIHRAVR